MRLRSYLQILTLVLCLIPDVMWASPNYPQPPSAVKTKTPQDSNSSAPKPYEMESLSLPTPQGQIPTNLSTPLRPTRTIRGHSRSILGGVWSGALLDTSTETAAGMTIVFQNENRNETAQSYGLSILANKAYGLHWDFQRHCCLGDYFEPNWGVGVGSLWSTDDAMASLANIERYHLRGRVGFEDLFNLDRRLRGEVVFKVSPLGFSMHAGLGWTWSDQEFWF